MTGDAKRAPQPDKRSFEGRSEPLLMLVSIVAGLIVWQLVAQRYSSFVLASPSAVVVRLGELIMDGQLPLAFVAALQHMVIGFLIACSIAFPLGFLMGRIRLVHDLIDPIVNLIYAVPSVAWAPFIIIWFGLYMEARIALVVMMCVFDMIIVITSGARNVDRKLMNVGRSFGASGWQRTWYVLLPESLPFTFTALRIGIVRAVNAMITAELFLAAVNLGQLMKQASVRFDSAAVLGILVVLSLTGLLLQELLLIAERRICVWRPNT